MALRRSTPGRLVYSSDAGRICPDCSQPVERCACSKRPKGDAARPAGDGVVRVRREVQGRRGKTVTTVTGVPLEDGELRALARKLKQRCGTGGTVKGSVIEIQGDHRDTLVQELEQAGYRVKKAGG